MIYIIKKDNTIQPFDIEKVIKAVNKSAFRAMHTFTEEELDHIKESVELTAKDSKNWEREKDGNGYVTVPMMHNIVEKNLELIAPSVAKSYRDYRDYKTSFVAILDSVYKKAQAIMYVGDKENANSDSTLVSTKRSLIFGQLNKELYQKFQLTTKMLQACRDGYIYIHDMSSRRDCFNCFRRDTRFITSVGVKSFYDFCDGDEVVVLTHLGNWKKAVVHKYGHQKIQKVTFVQNVDAKSRKHEVFVTENHRWILQDSSETTSLNIGDKLIPMPNISDFNWEDLSLKEKKLWCKGFAQGDGSICEREISDYVIIRLCGEKLIRYKQRFIDCGYTVTEPECYKGDGFVYLVDNTNKDVPFFELNCENIKYYMSGLLCADGHRRITESPLSEFKAIQVTGKLNKHMNDMLHMAGYFVTSTKDLTNQKTNYGIRTKKTVKYNFTTDQQHRGNWRVESIEPAVLNPKAEVWCLEVEDDHSFVLEGGIPTGNCCLFDVKRVLEGGFESGNIWYNEPKSVDTACDVIGDVILSAASQQYGGFTVVRIDEILSKYAHMSFNNYKKKYYKSKLKAFMQLMGYTSEDEVYQNFKSELEKQAEEEAFIDVRRDLEQGFQGLEIKLNTVASSRGDYPFTTFTIGASTEKFAALAAEVCLEVRKNGQGAPGKKKCVLFPKLVFTYTDELHGEGKELEWLFEKALDCSLKAMYPDYLSLDGETTVSKMYHTYGEIIAPINYLVAYNSDIIREVA